MFYLRAQATAREEQTPDEWALSAPSLLDASWTPGPTTACAASSWAACSSIPPCPPARRGGPGQCAPAGHRRQHGQRRSHQPVRPGDRGPHVVAGSDVAALRHRPHGVRDRGQAARALGHRPVLDADRLPAHPPARPAGGVRRPHRHHHGEAARALGGAGWNFYAYGLLEDVERDHHTSAEISGAGRAEIVFGTTELGLGALVQRGRKPQAGVDCLDRHLGPGLLRRDGPALRQRDRPGGGGARPGRPGPASHGRP